MTNRNRKGIDFALNNPITVAGKGDIEEIDTVTMFGPASSDRVESSGMKAFYSKVMADFRKSSEVKDMTEEQREEAQAKYKEEQEKKKEAGESVVEDDGMSGETLQNICNAVEIDVEKQNKVYDWFRNLLVKNKKGVLGDDQIKFTIPLFDDLEFHDMDRMCCEYAARFLIGSH